MGLVYLFLIGNVDASSVVGSYAVGNGLVSMHLHVSYRIFKGCLWSLRGCKGIFLKNVKLVIVGFMSCCSFLKFLVINFALVSD